MAKIKMTHNRNETPQSEKAKKGQKRNSAGGFVFKVTPWTQFRRFLILGTEGGTFYVGEKKLTKKNTTAALKCIREDGKRVVDEIVEVSDKALAPTNEPALYALALVAANGDAEEKSYALENLSKVARTGTHLLHFADYVSSLRGWGRGLRRAFGLWYTSKEPDSLAYQAIKYQQRDGWSHRDILRKAHPQTASTKVDAVLRWIVGGTDSLKARQLTDTKRDQSRKYPSRKKYLPEIILAAEEAKTASTSRLVDLIVEQNLPREAIPTEKLNELPVWDALLEKMPMTAMIRNLGKMSSIGLIKPLSAASKKVLGALGDPGAIKKARVHPMALLVASKVYQQGHGVKGSLSWSVDSNIVTALEQAFYASYSNVEPVGGPLLMALDVSGSMGCGISTGVLSCAEAAAALALIHMNVEAVGDAYAFGFANTFKDLKLRKGMSIADALSITRHMNFGSTDCSLPAQWALQNKIKVDGIFVVTDNETWAGSVHPFQALKAYRDKMGRPARQVVVAMTATPFTIADPEDPLSMDVVGFDASAPKIMADFAAGRLV